MFHRIHQKLGTAGFIISIVALVAALGGGAYAASGGLSGKQKKEVEKIAKKYAGKPGAAGATGATGAPGAKGDAGAAGSNGTNGTNGTSVTNTSVPTSSATCNHQGGAEFKVGSSAATTACNGVTGYTGTLPSGKTETGTFSYSAGELAPNQVLQVPISFSIPLAAPLGEGHVHLLNADGTKEIIENAQEEWEEITPTGCGIALTPTGTAANPAAAAGHLCIYTASSSPQMKEHAGSNYIVSPSSTCQSFGCLPAEGGPGSGAGITGARLQVLKGGSSGLFIAWGTWAVTAP